MNKFINFISIGLHLLVNGERPCDRRVELLLLQDTTGSFVTLVQDMEEQAQTLYEGLKNSGVGNVYITAAGFSDKPTPFRGYGGYGGAPGIKVDYCYDSSGSSPLTQDASLLAKGFHQAWVMPGSGGDLPENPYEAMIYAAIDPHINWSDPEKVFDDSGAFIVRIMLVVTDDFPHYQGEANEGIQDWNPNGTGNYPHFWNPIFCNYAPFYPIDDVCGKYDRLVTLHDQQNLTKDERDEYDGLLAILGPEYFQTVPDHPGPDFSIVSDCGHYEYPSINQVGQTLNDKKIYPIVLITGESFDIQADYAPSKCQSQGINDPVTDKSSWASCIEKVYTRDFNEAGFKQFAITPFSQDIDALIKDIIDTVNKLSSSIMCPDPEQSTEGELLSYPDETTDAAGIPVIPPPSSGNNDGSSAADGGNKGSSKTGVIAGATAGAAAGVAGIAALLYKGIGFGLLGGNTTSPMANLDQTNVPDTPVEREAYEEVTMDMFQ